MIKRPKRPPKTLKERKWLKRYIETGNATQAALEVYDTKNVNSAKNIGYQNVTKLDLSTIMDAKGLTNDNLMDHIVEGLEKPVKVTADGVEIPDYGVRHKYLETSLRLRGHGGSSNTYVQDNRKNTIVFTNFKDEAKG